MLKYVFYIAVVKSRDRGKPKHLVIRDDRKQLINALPIYLENDIEVIAEYDFKNKVVKRYTVKEFLSS